MQNGQDGAHGRSARDQDLRIGPRLTIPADELAFETSRSGGPGGQHVNKVETKVTLRWRPGASRVLSDRQRALLTERLAARLTRSGDLAVHASRYRSQSRNLEDARERLAGLVRAALAPVRQRKPTRPTRGSKERRLEAKRRRGETKRRRQRGGEEG